MRHRIVLLFSLLLIGVASVSAASFYTYIKVIDNGNKTVSYDFGDSITYLGKDYKIKVFTSIDKKPIVFTNSLDAINHLSLFGWELYGQPISENGKTTYILRHEVTDRLFMESKWNEQMKLLEQMEGKK